MAITLSLQTKERLREKADCEGRDVNTVADSLIRAALEWEVRERAEDMEGLRRGIAPSDAGRVRPLEDFAGEMRANYNLPTHLSDEEIGAEVIAFK